jgi:hypothetical protein
MRLAPVWLASGCLLLVDPFPECTPESCPDGYGCDWDRDECRTTCEEHEHCKVDHYCAGGTCLPDCRDEDCQLGCSSLLEACRCNENADCEPEERCCTSQRYDDEECGWPGTCF